MSLDLFHRSIGSGGFTDVIQHTLPEELYTGNYGGHLVTPKAVWYGGSTFFTGQRTLASNNSGAMLKCNNEGITTTNVSTITVSDPDEHSHPAVLEIGGYIYLLQANGQGENILIYKSTTQGGTSYALHHTITGVFAYCNARVFEGRIVIVTRDSSAPATINRFGQIVLYSDVGDFTTWTELATTNPDYQTNDVRHYPATPYCYGTNTWFHFIINKRSDVNSNTYYAHAFYKTQDFITYYNEAETWSKDIVTNGVITDTELETNCTLFGSDLEPSKKRDGANYIVIDDIIYGSYYDYDNSVFKFVKIDTATVTETICTIDFGRTFSVTNLSAIVMYYGTNDILMVTGNVDLYRSNLDFTDVSFVENLGDTNTINRGAIPCNISDIDGEYFIGGRATDTFFPYKKTNEKF